jgi:hypothetical protein
MTLDCPRLPECQEEATNAATRGALRGVGAYMAKKPKTSVVQRAKERISKEEQLKRSSVVAPHPEPVVVADVAVACSKHTAKTARQRHAQLATAARLGADPRMV